LFPNDVVTIRWHYRVNAPFYARPRRQVSPSRPRAAPAAVNSQAFTLSHNNESGRREYGTGEGQTAAGGLGLG